MAKDREYRAKRSEETLTDLLDGAEETLKALAREYERAITEVNNVIASLYGRYAQETGLTLDQVSKYMTTGENSQHRAVMKAYKGDNPKHVIELETQILEAKNRLTRLEAMEAEISTKLIELARKEEGLTREHLFKSLEESYSRGMFEEYRDQNPMVMDFMRKDLVRVPESQIEALLNTPWSGANYSENIRRASFDMKERIKRLVTQNIVEGRSIQYLSDQVAKELGKGYKNNASRLIRTETAYVKGQGDKLVYDKLKVKEYELLATLDSRTSSICQEMDGKHYPVSEAKVGVNYPPFHPNCRTTTIVYRENKEGRTRAARDKYGNRIDVPLDMKYKERKKKYIEN